MFKKVMSLALASTLVLSAGAFAASAAEAEDAVAANDESAVAADDSSAVAAGDESQVGAGTKIYFDVKSAGWKNFSTIYCHIWRADGTGKWPSWQTKKEVCKKESDDLYYYDITKTGNAEEIQNAGSKNLYCVIFSADTGSQIYNTIMNGNCIGDTVYVTGNKIENPKDSNKTDTEAAWKNHPECGPQKVITSTSKIVGTALADGTTDVTLMADYLLDYVSDEGVADTSKTDKTQDLINELKISPVAVMSNVNYKLKGFVEDAGTMTQDVADKKKATIEGILDNCTDPTKGGEKVNPDEIKNAEAKNDADSSSSGSSGSNGSNSGSSSNGSSSSSSSGSNSVQSGQETTIFFVFAGVMVAAAGVFFLVRRREN
jgi:LPXTG-motif cell wall-anchored protein